MLKFICYPKCATCQKAKKWLDDNKIEYELRDIKNKEVEHISECSYSVAVDIYDNIIYSLHCVYNYNTKAHFRLYKITCGITDAFYEGDQIEVEFPDVIDEYNGEYNNIDLSVVESTFIITINGKEYKLKHRDC